MPNKSSDQQSLQPENIPSCFSDTHGISATHQLFPKNEDQRCQLSKPSPVTTTTNTLPGYRVVKNLGTIYGLTVRSRNWGADIGNFFRSSVGGELPVLTNQLYRARNVAMDRMVGECMSRGGNAVLGVRMDVVAESVWSQVCAYGTAVVVEEIKGGAGDTGSTAVEDQ